MSARTLLLYFDGCPNVEQARQNLKLALSQAGLKACWDEVDLEDPGTPERWRGFPSPTVLIDGRDVVTGAGSASGAGACRVGGAPGAELILKRLPPKAAKLWLPAAGALPAVAIGLFPAAFCPACYPALAGLLSMVGLGALIDDAVLKPLTTAFLFVALSGLAYQARRAGRYLPAAIGSLGAMTMYAGLYLVPSPLFKWCGIAVLTGASLWNLVPGSNPGNTGGPSCPACETKEGGNDDG